MYPDLFRFIADLVARHRIPWPTHHEPVISRERRAEPSGSPDLARDREIYSRLLRGSSCAPDRPRPAGSPPRVRCGYRVSPRPGRRWISRPCNVCRKGLATAWTGLEMTCFAGSPCNRIDEEPKNKEQPRDVAPAAATLIRRGGDDALSGAVSRPVSMMNNRNVSRSQAILA